MPTLTLAANVNGTISGVAYNDLYLDSMGNIAVSRDQQALLEECSQATKTQLGEMVLNTDIGIPYANTLWLGVPNEQQFISAITNALLSVQGVLEVVSLITSQGGTLAADNYNFNAVIRTIYGTGVLNGG
jgi:hypothetical protein